MGMKLTRELETKLSQDERDRLLQMAHTNTVELRKIQAELDRLSGAVKRLKAQQVATQVDVDRQIEESASGLGVREVECEERRNGGTMEVIRLDTFEVIDTWEAPQMAIPGIDDMTTKPAEPTDAELLDALTVEPQPPRLIANSFGLSSYRGVRNRLNRLVEQGKAVAFGDGYALPSEEGAA